MWESQAAFSRDFSKPRWESRGAQSGFPPRRHFHSWLAVSRVATNPMWAKGNRDCFAQMFMYCDAAAS